MIDLRSDTVTRPTAAMRAAMAAAEVGDDVFGEDPTVQRLQERIAHTLGKDAALFVPSGTMANQLAILVHCRPGDEVVVTEGAHCAWYEAGAGAALAGVQFVHAGNDVAISPQALDAAVKPTAYYYPRTRLLALENTHNRSGGRVSLPSTVNAVASRARALGLAVHIDGARIFNAAAASGFSVATLAASADTISVCFSKGLGAPVGSALVGNRDTIRDALRLRKMLGGGMRQAGILAAAALYALDHHVVRLAEDHSNAARLAFHLASVPRLRVLTPETNIVMVDVPGDSSDAPAETFASRARDAGVLVSVFGPNRLRLVTHLDVSSEQCTRASEILAALAMEIPRV